MCSIDKTLARFARMRHKIKLQLVRQLSYVWKVYKRKKDREQRQAEERKLKQLNSKNSKGKKKSSQKNHSHMVKSKPSKIQVG